MKLVRILAVCAALGAVRVQPCTIFVLTDPDGALFCNNEDWFNRTTRLWFVPAGQDHLGCAFVGFDDGWAQGGVNTAGLAFDWWSSGKVDYTPDAALRPVRGNPSERMLESCTTVEQAIAFFQTYREPSFASGRILVADQTGASVVIYARHGRMQIELLNRTRGIGYARETLDRELPKAPKPTLENGRRILQACFQPGDGGTKYANVFDLKSGELFLYPSLEAEVVRLNLADELRKAGHYYDIPKLSEQVSQPARSLLPKMKRFYLDEFRPLAEQDRAVVERLRAIINDAVAGKMKRGDYRDDLWEKLSPMQKDVQTDMERLGALRALVVVEHREEAGRQTYRCVVDFEKARVLGRYDLDAEQRVTLIRSEFVELKR
jgi:hypothetical protein